MLTSQTKILGVIAGLVCVLSFAAVAGMLYGISRKNGTYEEELQARATRIATEKEVKSLEQLVVETRPDRAELASHMLTEDSVVDFLALIEGLARTRGITIETRSLAVVPIKGNAVFEQLTLEVNAIGSFGSVTEMLGLLESLPYQVQVRTVNVERTSELKGDNLWRGSYRVSVTKYK